MNEFNNLFNGNEYISIKDIEQIKLQYLSLYTKLKRNILTIFSKQKRTFIRNYLNIYSLVEHNNNIYVNNCKLKYQDILNNIKGYPLDNEQINCVVNKEEAALVIAGAGSGKSLTMIGKIRYLIETQYVEKNEILCISFTRESSNKLKKDLKNIYDYNVEVCTFHKLALNILKENGNDFYITASDTLNYIVDEFYDYLIYDYPIIMKWVIKFFFQNKKKKYTDISKSQINNFKNNIISFINLFKANINQEEILISYLKKIEDSNYYLMLNIIVIYKLYQNELKAQLEMDFDDLIKEATISINKEGIHKKYKYIIIDEYQDTSIIRVNLIKEIINKLNCKLIAVGDDFQSIYKFSGCNINTFLKFNEYFPYSKIFYIQNNYRNSQEIVDIAGNFVMKNKKQIKKIIHAHKNLEKPIKIVYYQNQKETFKKLIVYLKENKQNNILILGRNNKDIYRVINHDNELKIDNMNLYYLTVHKSKGLEEENIIILNMENDIMGFPSKLQSPDIINLIYQENEIIKYEEERRLFYVALTRSKNYVYLLANEKRTSYFIKELINDYPNKIEILGIK